MNKQPDKMTALYYRVASKDPNLYLGNQMHRLQSYAAENGIDAYTVYTDVGFSGLTFDRPGFQEMLADVKAGKINRVIVKDMSHFGRDYLQVGMYTDILFPDFGVHFIAVNDGVDSTRGDNGFTAIRNVFNEMYVRDTSKKIRATWQSKGKSGEHLTTIPPYGYRKDPENKRKWIVDPEAVAIVQKIFALCVDGMGPTQIAKWLWQNKVLNPTAYSRAHGLPTSNKPTADPYKWTNETVSRTLERVEYLGHTVNFKTKKQSYKSKKKLWNDPSEWAIWVCFPACCFAPIAAARCTNAGQMSLSRSSNTYLFHLPQRPYRMCNTHSIRNVALEEIVIRNLREAIAYVAQYEDDFIREAAETDTRARDKALAQKKDTLAQAEKRIAELDIIFKRIYEDNISGKLTDERFIKLSRDYELEQDNLKATSKILREEVKQQEKSKSNVKNFVTTAKKYTGLTELDATILREFIDKILVSKTSDKKGRKASDKVQEIEIVYNFIGAFDFGKAIEQAQINHEIAKVGIA